MDPDDGQAMFELQLELHAMATGALPPITADEVCEIRELLADPAGDLVSILAPGGGGRQDASPA